MAEDDGISPDALAQVQKRLNHDYKLLAAQVWGKRILRHLYMECGQGKSSFVRNEPGSTDFREGKRSIWLIIESSLRWKPDQREKFLTEENE